MMRPGSSLFSSKWNPRSQMRMTSSFRLNKFFVLVRDALSRARRSAHCPMRPEHYPIASARGFFLNIAPLPSGGNCEPILKCSWLNQSDNVIVRHGISLLRWRSEVVKQPHDMPPSRFDPSPTSGDSSGSAGGRPLPATRSWPPGTDSRSRNPSAKNEFHCVRPGLGYGGFTSCRPPSIGDHIRPTLLYAHRQTTGSYWRKKTHANTTRGSDRRTGGWHPVENHQCFGQGLTAGNAGKLRYSGRRLRLSHAHPRRACTVPILCRTRLHTGDGSARGDGGAA